MKSRRGRLSPLFSLSSLAMAGALCVGALAAGCAKPAPEGSRVSVDPASGARGVSPLQVCDRILVMMQSELSVEGAGMSSTELETMRGECVSDASAEQRETPEAFAMNSACIMESMTLAEVFECAGEGEDAQAGGEGGAGRAGSNGDTAQRRAECEALGQKFAEMFLAEAKEDPEFQTYPEEVLREAASVGMGEVVEQCIESDLDQASIDCALAANSLEDMEAC